MLRIRLAVFILFLFTFFGMAFCSSAIARAQPLPTPTPAVFIQAPMPDSALQGKVALIGSTAVDGMQSWMLEFGYTGDATHTWFIIAEGDQAITDGTLAEWDTTTLTDGNYTLRLTVQQGDTALEHLVPVRVRNYTPIETAIEQVTQAPAVTALDAKPTVTLAPSPVRPTLTPFPPNPAELTSQDIVSGLKTGAVLAVIITLLVAAYLYLHRIAHR